MDNHSSHMQLEPEGAERERQEKAVADQHKADLEHLLKNVHPSLRDVVSLGDASNGACQAISDYAATILRQEIELLKQDFDALRQDFETLRLQVLPHATPETPANETPKIPTNVFDSVPGIGAKAEEFASEVAPEVQKQL